jgi:hypothetical protein
LRDSSAPSRLNQCFPKDKVGQVPEIDVHIIQGSALLPDINEYSVASHQKHKARFLSEFGLIELPEHLLKNPERLAARLAKLAVDVAGHTAFLENARNLKSNPSESIFTDKKYLKKLDQSKEIIMKLKGYDSIIVSFLGHLNSLGYWELNESFDWHLSDHLQALQSWHRVHCGQVKAQMRDATLPPEERLAAREVYEQTELARMAHPHIALRRAVGQVAQEAFDAERCTSRAKLEVTAASMSP